MQIYLIRHGQKEDLPSNPNLTPLGYKQAEETGKYLAKFPITKVIASPLNRTVQTAEVITKELKLNFELDSNLVERMEWPKENIPRRDFTAEWVKATHQRDYQPKYGDSSLATGKRLEKVISNLDPIHQHVVLVTHGGAIFDYLRNVFNDEILKDLVIYYDGIGNDYQMKNCAINQVEITDSISLKKLNFTDHLSELSE